MMESSVMAKRVLSCIRSKGPVARFSRMGKFLSHFTRRISLRLEGTHFMSNGEAYGERVRMVLGAGSQDAPCLPCNQEGWAFHLFIPICTACTAVAPCYTQFMA